MKNFWFKFRSILILYGIILGTIGTLVFLKLIGIGGSTLTGIIYMFSFYFYFPYLFGGIYLAGILIGIHLVKDTAPRYLSSFWTPVLGSTAVFFLSAIIMAIIRLPE
ncbi:MAG TPA: hypothetical protein DEP42_00365 [Ruminococcaceae bacterium]|nr:hypothetical protein [Oscillospiraceae bacterium]